VIFIKYKIIAGICGQITEKCYNRKRSIMKKDNRQVMNALVLVFQFGINMIVPIFLCSLLGIWIGERTGISWIMIPFFFIGALAGGTNIYKMIKRLLK
jgi:predicted nucleic acid-binding Zn ribbon protein